MKYRIEQDAEGYWLLEGEVGEVELVISGPYKSSKGADEALQRTIREDKQCPVEK